MRAKNQARSVHVEAVYIRWMDGLMLLEILCRAKLCASALGRDCWGGKVCV